MHLLESSPMWIPYFGNQRRFTPFVKELLIGLGAKQGDTFIETNAGSNAINLMAASELGMEIISNDLSHYSNSIAKIFYGQSTNKDFDIVINGAALIEEYGWDLKRWKIGKKADPKLKRKWKKWLFQKASSLPKLEAKIINGDLFETLKTIRGDFIYIDFAWPWRDGRATEQYEMTIDKLCYALNLEPAPVHFKIPSSRQILHDVAKVLDLARPRAKFVILSNQSSNFPHPEVLDRWLPAIGHPYIIRREQTVLAEDVDNCGISEVFTEYQYVFEGKNV